MIQVCSRCATRWRVHDEQKIWCPRCHARLLSPLDSQYVLQADNFQRTQMNNVTLPGSQSSRYRWVAMRPGAPSIRKLKPKPLGPTPYYEHPPRWSLLEQELQQAVSSTSSTHSMGLQLSPRLIAQILRITSLICIAAMGSQLLLYVLLLINRTKLLFPMIALPVLWLARILEYSALITTVVCVFAVTHWFLSYRKKVFFKKQRQDPRSNRMLWLGCTFPIWNTITAPLYVIEMIRVQSRSQQAFFVVIRWWICWGMSTVCSLWATLTSYQHSAQGIANNILLSFVAYGFVVITLKMLIEVIDIFGGRIDTSHNPHRIIIPTDWDIDSDNNTHASLEKERDTTLAGL